MKKILIALAAAALALASCGPKGPAHPEWTYNTVMYEVNVRQFSPEGTFAGVQAQLPRLKDLGVDILWLMPMYEIGTVERKGTLGSYYAISDYTKVNPEFGTMADFEALLAEAHNLGFKVILDWVANQTAPDHVWMKEKPADFYERDAQGNAIYEYDWTDTRSLNYENKAVWAAQDECMRFWLDKGVDGFRCDAAGEMPAKFWNAILPKLKKDYPQAYFLAEAEKPELSKPYKNFDATYAWKLHHLMNDIAQNKAGVADLKAYLDEDDAWMGKEGFRLMFTSNHDENSWNGTEFERMGSAAHLMAALCFTLPKGQPLVYTGQEIGLDRRLEFFEKDPIEEWPYNTHTMFYERLIKMRHNYADVLAPGERGGKMTYIEGVPQNVFAFSRVKDGHEIRVYANLSITPTEVSLPAGYQNAMSGRDVDSSTSVLAPWSFVILGK